MNVAIIPARGGSKRIPGKNIKMFVGKPMIAYSITAALESKVFDHVLVSTDSPQIAEVALQWGAEVPFQRPADLANDTVGTDAVFLHAIEEAEKLYGAIQYACCIYATVPLLQCEFLQRGLKLLQDSGAASAFPVSTFPAPIFRALHINKHGRLEWHWPEFAETRSQDLPEVFHDAGQFYWVHVPRFKQNPNSAGADTMPIIMPRHLVQDIDTPEDWEVAEVLFQSLHFRNRPDASGK